MNQEKKVGSQMLIRFRTNYSEDVIEKVEVIRETKEFVYVPSRPMSKLQKAERREAKRSDFYNYHDTWEDAHSFLLERAEARVEGARERLERAQSHLESVKGIRQEVESE